MSDDPIFGSLGLLTRFSWLGAIASLIIWAIAVRRIWKQEGSRHYIVARTLSATTMMLMDVIIIIIFWPTDYVDRVIVLNGEQARAFVAFVVGNQLSAGIWQITAPKHEVKVRRIAGGWRRRKEGPKL